MVHIKDPLLLTEKSSPCSGSSGFPFSLAQYGPIMLFTVAAGVCGIVHIKNPLLLIGKSCSCIGSSGFPLSFE